MRNALSAAIAGVLLLSVALPAHAGVANIIARTIVRSAFRGAVEGAIDANRGCCWGSYSGPVIVGEDGYPPAAPQLRPDVAEQVAARDGRGLSLAGFYNDPSVALRRRAPVEPYASERR